MQIKNLHSQGNTSMPISSKLKLTDSILLKWTLEVPIKLWKCQWAPTCIWAECSKLIALWMETSAKVQIHGIISLPVLLILLDRFLLIIIQYSATIKTLSAIIWFVLATLILWTLISKNGEDKRVCWILHSWVSLNRTRRTLVNLTDILGLGHIVRDLNNSGNITFYGN